MTILGKTSRPILDTMRSRVVSPTTFHQPEQLDPLVKARRCFKGIWVQTERQIFVEASKATRLFEELSKGIVSINKLLPGKPG